jgi:hypothetical protein
LVEISWFWTDKVAQTDNSETLRRRRRRKIRRRRRRKGKENEFDS